jgi:hypothetical protein
LLIVQQQDQSGIERTGFPPASHRPDGMLEVAPIRRYPRR